MSTYESSFRKKAYLKNIIACTRLVDVASRTLLDQEYKQNMFSPLFDFNAEQKLYDHCAVSDDAVFHIKYEKGIPFLVILIPINENGQKLIAEYMFNINCKLYIDDIPFSATTVDLYEKMHRLAMTDDLTGLYNRRYINEVFSIDISACAERNSPMSVIFADLDDFKSANDKYGHVAGDNILRELSLELKRHIREGKDWAARYGGDEFLLCLGGVSNTKAKKVAERIRTAIESKAFAYNDNEIKLTCSFGVYTIEDFTNPPSVDSILDAIDEKLYQAKDRGRNMVV